jgi:hypothetical protein
MHALVRQEHAFLHAEVVRPPGLGRVDAHQLDEALRARVGAVEDALVDDGGGEDLVAAARDLGQAHDDVGGLAGEAGVAEAAHLGVDVADEAPGRLLQADLDRGVGRGDGDEHGDAERHRQEGQERAERPRGQAPPGEQ